MSIFLSRLLLPLETNHLHKSLFHITSVLSIKKPSFQQTFQDDSEVVLYGDNSKQPDKKLTFAVLKMIARKEKEEKGKNLVLVTVSGEPKTMPAFRLVNDTALEVLLRKARLNATKESFSILDLEHSEVVAKRVKQKNIIISCDSQQNVIDASVLQIKKELKKDNFVALTIKKSQKSSGQDQTHLDEFKKMLLEKCLEGDLKTKKSILTVKVIT